MPQLFNKHTDTPQKMAPIQFLDQGLNRETVTGKRFLVSVVFSFECIRTLAGGKNQKRQTVMLFTPVKQSFTTKATG